MNGQTFVDEGLPERRGRKRIGDTVMTQRIRSARKNNTQRETRECNIAILDMETDPFDNDKQGHVLPFLVVLYSDNFAPIIIWDENFQNLVKRLLAALDQLPDVYTIYAHNGGRFDFMFLIRWLRGDVKFKGRAIMAAKLGRHELRDSFHIIPEALAAYHKEKFDYAKLKRGARAKHKRETIDYCLSDCKYLLEIVKKFIGDFGLKMSIGQAAMAELKQSYTVKHLSAGWDEFLREYFFGGRVECLQGAGHFDGGYNLYDVNSMYPFVMANFTHPIGNIHDYDIRVGEPNENTVFIDLNCDNFGALVRRTDEKETSAIERNGNFKTTIWEYDVALKYGLIENVKINWCLDCKERTNFANFVLPRYARRELTKQLLANLKARGEENSAQYFDVKKDDTMHKLILNNAYGKFAQNPRNFKEHYLTDPDENPPIEWRKSLEQLPENVRLEYLLPAYECENYWIWCKPSPGFHFNNVGTAASITGAARAVLLETLQTAVDPIYCDTDSIIAKALPGVEIDPRKLGAWDQEAEFDEVILAGKKLYACKVKGFPDGHEKRIKIRSKGVTGLSWSDFLKLLDDQLVERVSFAPTLTKTGEQFYLSRRIRVTAPPRRIAAPFRQRLII